VWPVFKKLFSRSQSLNALLGDVIFATPSEHGTNSHSFFEWRVKKSVDSTKVYVSLAMIPDGYAGAQGSPTNYINFDLETAERVREHLTECIDVARRGQSSPAAASADNS
jgi:hypothetical protein